MLYRLFARLLVEKKDLCSSQLDLLLSTPLLRHNRFYDIVKFQIDLVILASSKNFDNRLHNLKCFFLFSRDFVLAFFWIVFFSIYI